MQQTIVLCLVALTVCGISADVAHLSSKENQQPFTQSLHPGSQANVYPGSVGGQDPNSQVVPVDGSAVSSQSVFPGFQGYKGDYSVASGRAFGVPAAYQSYPKSAFQYYPQYPYFPSSYPYQQYSSFPQSYSASPYVASPYSAVPYSAGVVSPYSAAPFSGYYPGYVGSSFPGASYPGYYPQSSVVDSVAQKQ